MGIKWSQRYSYCQAQTPAPSQQGSLGYYTTDCVAPLPHLFLYAAAQVPLRSRKLHAGTAALHCLASVFS